MKTWAKVTKLKDQTTIKEMMHSGGLLHSNEIFQVINELRRTS